MIGTTMKLGMQLGRKYVSKQVTGIAIICFDDGGTRWFMVAVFCSGMLRAWRREDGCLTNMLNNNEWVWMNHHSLFVKSRIYPPTQSPTSLHSLVIHIAPLIFPKTTQHTQSERYSSLDEKLGSSQEFFAADGSVLSQKGHCRRPHA
ncbi:hypothetical protein VNO78_23799 [Psophocarpus tetragonolobus]|uniref:Uncharacterized protein n=1 Tax=Psophocarpus tetragonolobus TaxID=3891 RepID=A0AAN9S7D4_PSOTE